MSRKSLSLEDRHEAINERREVSHAEEQSETTLTWTDPMEEHLSVKTIDGSLREKEAQAQRMAVDTDEWLKEHLFFNLQWNHPDASDSQIDILLRANCTNSCLHYDFSSLAGEQDVRTAHDTLEDATDLHPV